MLYIVTYRVTQQLNERILIMWIRIFGTLYNLSLVQSIEVDMEREELYFHYGASGLNGNGIGAGIAHHSTTIVFKDRKYGELEGCNIPAHEILLATYEQIMKVVNGYESDPIEFEKEMTKHWRESGAHPDAEFIEG